MFDMLGLLLRELHDGRSVALATVTRTGGSSPREVGASMFLSEDGSVSGSVSGGCVEGAVYEVAQQVLEDGTPRAERFGFSDDDAFAVGLTCGGILDIFIHRLTPADIDLITTAVAAVDADRPVAVATVIEHPEAEWLGRLIAVTPDDSVGTFKSNFADHAVVDDSRGQLVSGTSEIVRYGARGERLGNEMAVFICSFQPKPRMLIFGAVDFAGAVADQAALLGFTVTVCDARPIFATTERFPSAHEVVAEWPHRFLESELEAGKIDPRTAVCVLTHDAKFDVPLLTTLLQLPDAQRPTYIGVMGSRRTHDHRIARLEEAGLTEQDLAVMRSPIGLDLKGRTPQETAVSIMAEVIAERWGGSGLPLSKTTGDIHGK